jgi:hypothetical protein
MFNGGQSRAIVVRDLRVLVSAGTSGIGRVAERSPAPGPRSISPVRQRLDALREITGGWDDPVKALELHFALRLSAILA